MNVYHLMWDHTETGWDRSTIVSSSCRTNNLLSEHIIGDIVPHYLDLLFEGQRFESATFRKFLHDYLANDDRYGTTYYCHPIGSHVLTFDWHIYVWPWPVLKIKVMHISPVNTLTRKISLDADIWRNAAWLSFIEFFTIELQMALTLTFRMDQCQM